MNCPHCGYEHRTFNNESCEYELNQEYGKFFSLPIEVERSCFRYDKERRNVYGCPKCNIIFMDY